VGANARAIRGLLGNRIRHQMRVIPELRFFEDDSLDYIENIDNLLHSGK
jgi:ribosome-binding factor A